MYTHEEINQLHDQLHTAVEAIETAHSKLDWYGHFAADEAKAILEKALEKIHGRKEKK